MQVNRKSFHVSELMVMFFELQKRWSGMILKLKFSIPKCLKNAKDKACESKHNNVLSNIIYITWEGLHVSTLLSHLQAWRDPDAR
jgi:hypothetical protein